jgi:adenylate cyclase
MTATLRGRARWPASSPTWVEASTDRQLWSEKFDRTTEDAFQIQEGIASKIVDALEVRFTDAERRDAAERPIDDPVASDCYLRARQRTYDWNEEAQRRALRLVDEAIGVAGESALLLAPKGQIHWNMVDSGVAELEEGLGKASELVDRAFALSPRHPVAVFVRGLVAATRGRSDAALRNLHAAHRLRPGDTNVLTELMRWAMSGGLGAAVKYGEQLMRLDPLSVFWHVGRGHSLVLHGERDEALPHLRRAQELAPALRLQMLVGYCMSETVRFDEAAQVLERAAGRSWSRGPHSD